MLAAMAGLRAGGRRLDQPSSGVRRGPGTAAGRSSSAPQPDVTMGTWMPAGRRSSVAASREAVVGIMHPRVAAR